MTFQLRIIDLDATIMTYNYYSPWEYIRIKLDDPNTGVIIE